MRCGVLLKERVLKLAFMVGSGFVENDVSVVVGNAVYNIPVNMAQKTGKI